MQNKKASRLSGEQLLKLKSTLDELVDLYASPDFIEDDPIQIPHRFVKKQDIEIAGFIAAIFAWGQRKTIIAKATDFLRRMEDTPLAFVQSYGEDDQTRYQDFKHRTFNEQDAHAVLSWLRMVYTTAEDMEDFLFHEMSSPTAYLALARLRDSFEALPTTPPRSLKHIADPRRGSACKRLNMFFRWMVRPPKEGVDFGLWTRLKPADLIVPLDLHVLRSAESLGLIKNAKGDWKTAVSLTEKLRQLDHKDPVRYDYALFAASVER